MEDQNITKTAENKNKNDQILHEKFVQLGRNAKEWMRKCVLLLPEIEKHRIWEKKGFGSIYEYAAKLAGMSHNVVYDALRILEKIEDKPALKKVVEKKGVNAVRPVAAIATKENEKFWAEKAEKMGKNTLEIYVREFRGLSCTSTKQDKEKENVNISMELSPEIAAQLHKLNRQKDWNELMKELLKLREEKLIKEKIEIQKRNPKRAKSRYIPSKSTGKLEKIQK